MKTTKYFRLLLPVILGWCFMLVASAQVKPNNQTVPNATTQTLKITPAAYSSTMQLNLVRVWEAEMPFSTDTAISSYYRQVQEVKQTGQYYDGLGRPVQAVVKGVSPGGKDVVTPVLYDSFGREAYKYMGYVAPDSDGEFKTDPFNEQNSFLQVMFNPMNDANGEKFFYGKTDYELSPLNRINAVYASGNSWVGSAVGISQQYLFNSATDSVRIWSISNTAGATPTSSSYYAAGVLNENVTTDERGYQVVEYIDKNDRTILKKVQISATPSAGHTGWLCTYYVYDDWDNVRYVMQPKATDWLKTNNWTFDATTWASSTIAKELCFSNEYDIKNRLIIKRVPGAGETWMVYDSRNRLIMTQDANLRNTPGRWLYTTYDSLNRAMLTGIWTNSGDRTYHQNLANNGGNYPNPTTGFTVLIQTYYDNYSWVSSTGSGLPTTAYTGYNNNSTYFYTASDITFPYPRALTTTNLTRGLVTGTKVNVLNTGTYLYSVSFFDDRARVAQTQSTNYTGDIDTTITQYSFNSRILRTLVCHGKGGTNPQAYKVLTKLTYDAAGRITQVNKKTGNSAEVIIAQNQYDELGQLKKKNIGQKRNSLTDYSYTSNPVDSLNFNYNIRGWLRGINMDYADSLNNAVNWFGMELNYDFGFTTSQFNGNIAGIKWRNATDAARRAYGFSYDAANRLIKADFTQKANSWDINVRIDFSVHSISYDQNGNILTMNQMGVKLSATSLIDSLAYGYVTNSNRLNYVTDYQNDTSAHLGDFTETNNNSTQDYLYDANGSITQDNNKNIANIHYNYLNLPDTITVTGQGKVIYVYTATGSKLRKITTDTTTSPDKITRTDYAGPFMYQNDTLQYIAQEEGRVRPKRVNYADTMFYDYFEKDHLGNTRVVLTDERQQDIYPAATVENNTNSFALQKTFYTINTADTISLKNIASWGSTVPRPVYNNNGNPPYNNDPYLTTTDSSKVVYRLNGQTGDKTGLGITLKVMTGDVVNIYAKSFWHNSGTVANLYRIAPALLAFLTTFAGTPAVAEAGKGSSGVIASSINNNLPDANYLRSYLDTSRPINNSVPKAYLNWILFDEQFNPVSSGSGYDFINTNPDIVKTHSKTVNINKAGYLYVYCSNESNLDVFFDNLQVIHTRGPLLEASDYYPFGLVQNGISSQSAGKLDSKIKYNGKELQNAEFSTGRGLEWYDYGARMYDGQIGRFATQDPHAFYYQNVSPYTYVVDNPLSYIDPTGEDYYFDYDGNYLGSDGIGEELRLVHKPDYETSQQRAKEAAKSQNLKKDAKQTFINNSVHSALTQQDEQGNTKSRQITISGDEAVEARNAGTSTIDYLYNQTNNDVNGNERDVFIYLNTNTATIEFGSVQVAQPNGDNSWNIRIDKSPADGYVLMGNIHGHPDQRNSRYNSVEPGSPGYSPWDQALANDRNIPVYSVERNGNGRGPTNVYVNPPNTSNAQKYYQYQGQRDARSLKQDAIWQKIRQ